MFETEDPAALGGSGCSDHAALSIQSVSVHYGGISALDDLTIDIPAGELRGLIGPNGAGKTTLFDVISGIRPPTKGEILLNGQNVTSLTSMQRARMGLRRTFQRQQVFSWLTVEDNVLTALEWRARGGGVLADALGAPWRRRQERGRRERTREVLGWCGLSEIRTSIVGHLPPGQVRLVELARALVDQPSVLLLDEPTSGLGPTEGRLVSESVKRYVSEQGCTAVVVEHDVEFVVNLCDRVTVLDAGRIIFDGSPDAVQEDAQVRRAYLG
jgi:ABC-type branched-subunit amino acid transport system ATPase component